MTIFQKGEEWLEEVKRYISTNKKSADNFMKKHIPSFHLVDSDATYLLRIECKRFSPFVDLFCSYLKDKKGPLVSSESSYGENESDFIRINIPCPKERLIDGLRRLEIGGEEFSDKYSSLATKNKYK